jgi:hypothetical protein
LVDERPFEDVVYTRHGFSIPTLKWRELLFVGALRPQGDHFVRDLSRPLPPFRDDALFPDDAKYTVTVSASRTELRRIR